MENLSLLIFYRSLTGSGIRSDIIRSQVNDKARFW